MWWGDLKQRIKMKFINYAKLKRQQVNRMERESQLVLAAQDLDGGRSGDTTSYKILCEALRQLEVTKCKGAAIRSKALSYLEGERCTSYFLRLEKRKQYINIAALKTRDGSIVTFSEDIVHTAQLYFTDLFKSTAPDRVAVNRVLSSLQRSLNRQDKEWCDMDFK